MSHEQLESCVDTQVGEVRVACVEKRIIDDAALDHITCARLVSSLARHEPVSQAHFYACALQRVRRFDAKREKLAGLGLGEGAGITPRV
jgi:hypothetical protein